MKSDEDVILAVGDTTEAALKNSYDKIVKFLS